MGQNPTKRESWLNVLEMRTVTQTRAPWGTIIPRTPCIWDLVLSVIDETKQEWRKRSPTHCHCTDGEEDGRKERREQQRDKI